MANTLQDIARKALAKKLDKLVSKEDQERIGFYIDTETTRSYSWHFILDGVKTEMAYGYLSKTVTVCGVSNR